MIDKKRISDIPKDERPYEKCLSLGPKSLTDAELLAVIIRMGNNKKNSIQLAYEILNYCDENKGLLGLMHISAEQLMTIDGIGKVKAVQLKCIGELSKRISKASAKKTLRFNSPASVASYYMEELRHSEKEFVYVLFLDTKSFLIKSLNISVGTVNQSLISPREIMIEALKCYAVNIILIHNHPSGDPTPSKEDVLATNRISNAGKLIGIFVIDHIIIGDNSYISLKEKGLL